MASNQNVNKVVYGGTTLIDITDTTATEENVAEGAVFYKADGTRSVGTMTSGLPELTITGTCSPTVSGGSIQESNFKYALSADRTVGMIWGDALVRAAGATTGVTMDLGVTVSAGGSAKTVRGIINGTITTNTAAAYSGLYMQIASNGAVSLHYMGTTNLNYISIPPTLVRFSDL